MSFAVGHKCELTVSEPWDYEIPTGGNLIVGHILDIRTKNIMFESEKLTKFDKGQGKSLVLRCRYKEEVDIQTMRRLTVNGGLLRIPYNISMSEQELKEQSDFVLIGCVEPIK